MNGSEKIILPSPLEVLSDPLFEKKEVKVLIKRDDLIHPLISGNKWRKLKYNLGDKPILTYGGAYSNHIVATAIACYQKGIECVGIIRGEKTQALNDSLQIAKDHGMRLEWMSREEYRKKDTPKSLKEMRHRYPDHSIIPEGGANEEGMKGCSDIVEEMTEEFDFILSAMGTGATVAGIANALKKHQKVVAISVLKNAHYLEEEIAKVCDNKSAIDYQHDYHFGGYAKIKDSLIERMQNFNLEHSIQTDPIYSGKSLYALFDLISKDYFARGSKIIFYHCGGLQGIKGMEKRYKFRLYPDY